MMAASASAASLPAEGGATNVGAKRAKLSVNFCSASRFDIQQSRGHRGLHSKRDQSDREPPAARAKQFPEDSPEHGPERGVTSSLTRNTDADRRAMRCSSGTRLAE